MNGDNFKKIDSEREEEIQKLGEVTGGKGFYLKKESINYLITQMISTLNFNLKKADLSSESR